jgi:hypothetical protein
MEDFKPVKGGLRLKEDSGEESEDEEKSVNVSYLDDSASVEEISVHCLNLEGKKGVQKGCKSELEEIADRLFGQIFSQEYLRNPFSC